MTNAYRLLVSSSPSSLAISSVLLLVLPPISLILLTTKWLSGHLSTSSAVLFTLLALFSAASGALELTISLHGLPLLSDLSAAFESAFECSLSMITLVILRRIAHYKHVSLLPLLCLAAVLTVCELVFSAIPQSPFLLSPFLAAMSRFLSFACLSYIILARLPATGGILSENGKPDRYPPRVSSPTPETWPFPASLARHQTKAGRETTINLAIVPPASTATKNDLWRIPLALALSQVFALLCAALDIVLEITVSHMATDFNLAKAGSVVPTRLLDFFIARAAGTCAWSVALLIAIHAMPPTAALGPPTQEPPPTKEVMKPTIPKRGIHTSISSFSRFAHSDSASDYLFVPDPFASMPPPLLPPAAAALGLDLDEVSGAKAIGVQYRFAAPRSKARRRVEPKKSRSMSRDEALKRQNSTEPFIPRHPLPLNVFLHAGIASEMDEERDWNLGDGATLAQLFLRSLNQDVPTGELRSSSMRDNARASTPHLERYPLRSHWSCSSTLKSTRVHSRCSSSHRSGVSLATSEDQLKRGGSINKMTTDAPASCPSSIDACESEDRVG